MAVIRARAKSVFPRLAYMPRLFPLRRGDLRRCKPSYVSHLISNIVNGIKSAWELVDEMDFRLALVFTGLELFDIMHDKNERFSVGLSAC